MEEKIALCGDNCVECPRYNAHSDEQLKTVAELWYKVGWRKTVVSNEEIACNGCSSHKQCTYRLVECTKEHGVECIHPILFNLTEECFREMKDNEIEVNTWTINEKVDIERLAKMGVDALIGNYPDRIKNVLENLK